MSVRLVLVRTSLKPLAGGVRTCTRSISSLQVSQLRSPVKAIYDVARLSIKRASTSSSKTSPGGKPAADGPKYAYPESLMIYHAGTGRTTFIACLKLATIFVFVFFGLVVTPSYISSDRPLWQAGGLFLCGLIPLLSVAYITSPFVSTIRIRLPFFARQSSTLFERWASARTGLPPATVLEMSTLSFIGKPRVSRVTVGDLVPVRQRFGLVNYLRKNVEAENAKRRWWMFPAVGKFNVTPGGEKTVKNGSIWTKVAESIAQGGR